jgi:membrane protein DedA with SNARE-associated domain
VIEFAVDLISQIGLLGAAFLIGIEVIIPPIPSEAVLLLTGFNVSLGRFGFVEAILATTVGSLVGATFWFALAHLFTENRLSGLILKHGRWVGLSHDSFKKSMAWFARYGSSLVFFGRMVPIVRSLISIPAGLVKMSLAKFYFFSTCGMIIWNTLWISIGMNLGENWKAGEEFAQFLDWVVYALVAILAIYVLVNVVRQLSKRKSK